MAIRCNRCGMPRPDDFLHNADGCIASLRERVAELEPKAAFYKTAVANGAAAQRWAREQQATIERLWGALAKLLEPSCIGDHKDNPASYHDNEHHASCAMMDCGCMERHIRAALTGSDLGPVKSPNLWADVRDGSPGDVGWDGEDRGCSKCGADAGAQCSFQTVAGDGCEVGGWVHVERLEATDPDRGPGEGE